MHSIKLIFSKRRYFSAAFLFASFSLSFSTWAINIPAIAVKICLSEGELGVALLLSAVGAIIATPFGKSTIKKIGEGTLSFYTVVLYAVACYIPFLVSEYLIFCIALFFLGFTSGLCAISVNSLIALIEKTDNVKIMSAVHGFFSAGGMIGAGLGSLLISILPDHRIHGGLIMVLIICLQWYLKKNYYLIKNESDSLQRTKRVKNVFPLIPLIIAGVVVLVSEGAIADWSALYLNKIVSVDLSVAGLGYAGFSLAMMIGRFLGDGISNFFKSWQIITAGYLVAIAGIALVLTSSPLFSITGFTVVGLGFSVIVPEVIRAASDIKEIETAAAVSYIFGAGFVGFLGGPVLLGFVAEMSDLRMSFFVILFFVLLGFFVSVRKSMIQKRHLKKGRLIPGFSSPWHKK